MSWTPSRLRGGEWLAATGALVGLVALYGPHWFAGRSGWNSAADLRWLDLLAIAVGLALVVTQGACRAPALPACLSVVSSVVAFLAGIGLLVRVLVDPGAHEQIGAWVALLAGLGLFAGSYWSLREEGIRPQDGPGEIPVIALGPAPEA